MTTSRVLRRVQARPDPGPGAARRPWLRRAAALGLGGARLGDHRAADRVRRARPRSSADGPPLGRASSPRPGSAWTGPGPLRDVPTAETLPPRARPSSRDGSLGRALDRDAALRPRGLDRAGRPRRPRATRGCVDPRDRPLDAACLGLTAAGCRLAAGGRPRLRQARRPPAELGRRATIPEIDEFFEPSPFRGLAGTFAITHYHLAVATGPPYAARGLSARRPPRPLRREPVAGDTRS